MTQSVLSAKALPGEKVPVFDCTKACAAFKRSLKAYLASIQPVDSDELDIRDSSVRGEAGFYQVYVVYPYDVQEQYDGIWEKVRALANDALKSGVLAALSRRREYSPSSLLYRYNVPLMKAIQDYQAKHKGLHPDQAGKKWDIANRLPKGHGHASDDRRVSPKEYFSAEEYRNWLDELKRVVFDIQPDISTAMPLCGALIAEGWQEHPVDKHPILIVKQANMRSLRERVLDRHLQETSHS